MIDINRFMSDELGPIGLLIKNKEDINKFDNNEEIILNAIFNKLNNINVSQLNIYNNVFLNSEFLKNILQIKTLECIYIFDRVENCREIVNIFKNSNVEICFGYEFYPNQEEYYNKELYSFTQYPYNFNIHSNNQNLVIDNAQSIDILCKLLDLIKQDNITIEFDDSSVLKKVIDCISADNINLYLNDSIKSDDIDYILNKNPNTKFIIKGTTLYEYDIEVPYEKIKEKENIINSIINEIKQYNFSPFEQYMYIYNIVKNFKPYQESPDNYLKSRSTYLLIDNNYIVCEGYANLLEEIIKKLGNSNIQCVKYGLAQIDDAKEVWHARNLVYINDEKYGINNVFVSDPTWDSINSHKSKRLQNKFPFVVNARYDWYNHFMLTPDMIVSERPLKVIDDMALKIVDNSICFSELSLKNQKALNKFLNNNVELMNQLFLTKVPNEAIESAIYKIYSIIYKNFSIDMVKNTIETNNIMSNILFENSKQNKL